ncbi:MAG: hypothetical protein ACK51Z_05625 [Pseudomonadota bacterium]|jgi:hypothetical protein
MHGPVCPKVAQARHAELAVAAALRGQVLRQHDQVLRQHGLRTVLGAAIVEAAEAVEPARPHPLHAAEASAVHAGAGKALRHAGIGELGAAQARAAVAEDAAHGAEEQAQAKGAALTPGTDLDDVHHTSERLRAGIEEAAIPGRDAAVHAIGATGVIQAVRAGHHAGVLNVRGDPLEDTLCAANPDRHAIVIKAGQWVQRAEPWGTVRSGSCKPSRRSCRGRRRGTRRRRRCSTS